MTNKELLVDFINYCRNRHVMPILHDHIAPLADDYLQEQLLQQTPCTTQVCPRCKDQHTENDCGGYCSASCMQEDEG